MSTDQTIFDVLRTFSGVSYAFMLLVLQARQTALNSTPVRTAPCMLHASFVMARVPQTLQPPNAPSAATPRH
jgi:hypothetical protein